MGHTPPFALVSRTPASPSPANIRDDNKVVAFGRVEDGRGSLGPSGQHPVSHPRSSNRTCRLPASGSPTGFTARHSARHLEAGVRGAADRVLHRQRHRRTDGNRALPPCAFWQGSHAHARRRTGQLHGMPSGASRSRSSSTSRTRTCSTRPEPSATDRCCQVPGDCRLSSLSTARSSWTGTRSGTTCRSLCNGLARTSSPGSRSVTAGHSSTRFWLR